MSKTANTSTSTKDKYPHAVSASSVSERFYDAVRLAARKQGLTLQTYARWCVEQALGRNTPRPSPEVAGVYTLGTQVDGPTNAALTSALKGKGPEGTDYPKAQWLREVLAKAAGYTMGPDDIAGNPGEAAKKRAEQNRTRDSVMAQLWETNPDMVRATARALGKSLRDLGIYDETEEDEAAEEAVEQEPVAV